MRRLASTCFLMAAACAGPARGHDIPNAQVDRAIQATVRPGSLEVAYEVSLAELTLTQDLRDLLGQLPGGDRDAWFASYGRETGPLNARGLLVSVDGRPIDLRFSRFDLAVEGHPRFTFRLDAPLPRRGRLKLQDTNFVSSEGTSRLAIRGLDGARIRGDSLPADISEIPARPVWQLSDAEERRTRQVEVTFEDSATGSTNLPGPPPRIARAGGRARIDVGRPRAGAEGLSALLGRSSGWSFAWLGLVAFGLGAAHAIQPGHGKTLVAAMAVGDRGGPWRGAALALVVTIVHVGGVLAVAAALRATRTIRYAEIDRGLAHLAGFGLAAVGLWRVGRHLAGYSEHDEESDAPDAVAIAVGDRGLIAVGVAGGMVPCWDAVLLIVLAEALGRLALGLALLAAFSSGMAAVLVAIGLLAGRLRRALSGRGDGTDWGRRLGLASGLAFTTIGLLLLAG